MSILDFLFPNYTCLVCKGEINKSDNEFICEDCAKALPFCESVCEKCGRPIGIHANICDRCKDMEWHFDKACAVFTYKDVIVDLILGLKYNEQGDFAKAAAPFIAQLYNKIGFSADIIVPVPLSSGRFKERGFNQAGLIANELSRLIGVRVCDTALVRTKQTEAQIDMSPKQRQENLKNAFAVTDRKAVTGKRVLVVDDVLTTGATTDECAKVIKKAGAQAVIVLTVAVTDAKR